MRLLLLSFFSFCTVAILPVSAQGQVLLDSLSEVVSSDSASIETKSVSMEKEEVKLKMPFFSAVGVLYDYGKLAGLLLETESKQEVGVQLEFWNKLVFTGDLGIAELRPDNAYKNADYVSEGWYYRAGLGYKLDMSIKNNFLFSIRYGQSFFSDMGNIEIQSQSGIYDEYNELFNRKDLLASWYEVVLSSERRIWKGLYAGFHLRLRILDDYDRQEPLDVYSIPGYGRTFDKTVPAVNLYIKYSFERFGGE